MGKTRTRGRSNDLGRMMESLRWLLMRPTGKGLAFRDGCDLERLQVLYRALELAADGSTDKRCGELAACLESLAEPPDIARILGSAVADALIDRISPDSACDDTVNRCLHHGQVLLGPSLASLRDCICAAARRQADGMIDESLPHLAKANIGQPDPFWSSLQLPLDDAGRDRLRQWLICRDRFSTGSTYRVTDTGISPTRAAQTRPLEMLYGYRWEKGILNEHFQAFAQGRMVPPLALWGLPGLGKTHFAIAYTRAFDCILVTADERTLETSLERVLTELGRYRHRRFVLFFDDIETEETDWGIFRHQVSGHLPYPANVLIILASNYPFPPSVRSRCAMLPFRPIGPAVCMEIVSDYLHKQLGLSGEHQRLAQVMVADYVNEYVQHRMPELSPRTLIRYLELVEADADWRRRLIEESLVDPIRTPTVDMFIESNKALTDEMNVGRERYAWRPQDIRE